MASPFGIKVPPKGRARFQAKLRPGRKSGLRRIEFSGSIRTATSLIFPGSAGHPARLTGGSSCFWAFVLRIRRESRPSVRVGLFAIRVNAVEGLALAPDISGWVAAAAGKAECEERREIVWLATLTRIPVLPPWPARRDVPR